MLKKLSILRKAVCSLRFGLIPFVCLLLTPLLFSHKINSRDSFLRVSLSGFAQGTTWALTYYAKDSAVTKNQIDSILLVIDSSLSIYKTYSRITKFNNSKKGVKVDEHFSKVMQISLDTYKKTNGLFDITVLPLVEAWGFGATKLKSLPDSATIASLLTCVGSKYLKLNNDFLSKSKPCVKIDVNGIAQGYSVDVIAGFLEKNEIHNYIVELGGELRVQGTKKPGDEIFKVGIEAPNEDDFTATPIKKIIALRNGAITTSGNYRKYYESKGKKISHLLDPRTGYSIQNELISVTVYAKNAVTADAYDNALMNMGLSEAMKFLQTRTDLGAYFIYHLPNGTLADTASAQFYKILMN